MALFVHLTSAGHAPRIRRSGLRAASTGQGGLRGVYCFPVLPSYTLTHQWLRELAREGSRGGLVAVHVRLPDGEPVLLGRYADRARGRQAEVTAAEAVQRVRALDDPRGWEVFLPRAVGPREIHRVRRPPQVTGWRHWPGAHGTRPCTCAGCRIRGEYGSRRLRARLPHPLDGPPPPVRTLLATLATATDPAVLRATLHWFALRRKGPLPALVPFATHPDPTVREALARAVAAWSTPGTRDLLTILAKDADPEVREAAEAVLGED
ncbi:MULTISPECIES: HEAT repeat domain-containing protein [unclassified Streptomyces]|uniref:HEAT repeat domain-containing protein n=1 Tax=unclassified Streptomyces TaxID=2593676 RepID=UPI00081E020F|nr:HEAT repeat domain-containing protein [Streptomyces sp. LcepLS]MYR30609.1 HEAT repeat domain-containing protein [Streptomyces sp. SID4945]SCF50231.1 HEAT repeat-containing protein [Streptomyces sp. LcepLS]